MRGAARLGGRSFRPPENIRRGLDPLEFIENAPSFSDLDVAPRLEPINDEWSISDPFEAVDPRDCAKHPASPYCENDLFRFGPPIGFDVDIRINGCTICVYIYPVVGFMRLTPTVVCRRDPNCDEDRDEDRDRDRDRDFGRPPRLNENVQPDAYKSLQCAFRERNINIETNDNNDAAERELRERASGFVDTRGVITEVRNVKFITVTRTSILTNRFLTQDQNESGCFDSLSSPFGVYNSERQRIVGQFVFYKFGDTVTSTNVIVTGEERDKSTDLITGNINFTNWRPLSYVAPFSTWKPSECCGMQKRPTIKPPPPLPPPFGRDDDRKRTRDRRGCDQVCCNSCNDSKENTDELLREIRAIKKALGTGELDKAKNAAVGIGDNSVTGLLNKVARRIGLDSYPIEVPESLLQGQGDKIVRLQSNAEVLYWLIGQVDALVGQFPIDIDVKDIDPLKAGDQKKTIVLPNIAEAIAEMYGLTIKNSVNQEVELNMLLRLAAEVIATKNAAVVTQDYARANANFLGYKANYKPRELIYNFDFNSVNLDPRSKEPIIMEKLLKTVKGYVQGWQLEDKETVVGFLQKLMFSAGIIKAVFFRGKGNQKELRREINSMSSDEAKQDKKFDEFIKEMNDPNSKYNRTTQEKPEIKQEPDTNPKESK
jgi:hypothetical protein